LITRPKEFKKSEHILFVEKILYKGHTVPVNIVMTGNLMLNLYKEHQGLSFKACVSSFELLYIVYEHAVDNSSDKALLVTL